MAEPCNAHFADRPPEHIVRRRTGCLRHCSPNQPDMIHPVGRHDSFHDYVVDDLLAGIPGIESRAMFGGWGIYRDGTIFAIIVEGELYFKAGDRNRADYEKMGSRPFTYARKGKKSVAMSYWLVPPEILEDRNRLRDWVDRAVAASRSFPKEKPRTPRGTGKISGSRSNHLNG